MARTLIAACGGSTVARLRKTFPVTPEAATTAVLQRRGRLLSHKDLTLVELPAVAEASTADPVEADVTAELALYLGNCPDCTAVILVIPAPELILADRITAPGRRELIPDLLEPASRIDESVRVAAIDNSPAWVAAQWALRRLGPHQLWVVGLPTPESRGASHGDTDRATHRGLRSVVAALEEQNR